MDRLDLPSYSDVMLNLTLDARRVSLNGLGVLFFCALFSTKSQVYYADSPIQTSRQCAFLISDFMTGYLLQSWQPGDICFYAPWYRLSSEIVFDRFLGLSNSLSFKSYSTQILAGVCGLYRPPGLRPSTLHGGANSFRLVLPSSPHSGREVTQSVIKALAPVLRG